MSFERQVGMPKNFFCFFTKEEMAGFDWELINKNTLSDMEFYIFQKTLSRPSKNSKAKYYWKGSDGISYVWNSFGQD
jgi:hypothetical protein